MKSIRTLPFNEFRIFFEPIDICRYLKSLKAERSFQIPNLLFQTSLWTVVILFEVFFQPSLPFYLVKVCCFSSNNVFLFAQVFDKNEC